MTFDARAFITAGRAVFTLQGRDARYTFRVDKSKSIREGRRAWFISMLTGPNNTRDYTYLGLLDEQTGAIRLTAKSRYTDASTPVVALRWALGIVWRGATLPLPAQLYHVGRCGRCGRALTVPSSIDAGIGPECATKL